MFEGWSGSSGSSFVWSDYRCPVGIATTAVVLAVKRLYPRLYVRRVMPLVCSGLEVFVINGFVPGNVGRNAFVLNTLCLHVSRDSEPAVDCVYRKQRSSGLTDLSVLSFTTRSMLT